MRLHIGSRDAGDDKGNKIARSLLSILLPAVNHEDTLNTRPSSVSKDKNIVLQRKLSLSYEIIVI